jgi:hypothetical protein
MGSNNLVNDIPSFETCSLCLTSLPLLILHIYVACLFMNQLVHLRQFKYDLLDAAIFTMSIICFISHFFSILIASKPVSTLTLICQLIWSVCLSYIMARMVLRKRNCLKVISIIVITLVTYFGISIIQFNVIPLRYSLLAINLFNTICGIYQCYLIG